MKYFSDMKKVFREGSGYSWLFISLMLYGVSYGLFKGTSDNYLAEIVGMGEFERGVAEFFRELPGLLLIFILALFYKRSAEQLYKLGNIIMVAGMLLLALVSPTKFMVILAIGIYSLGEHIQIGMRSTLALEYALPGKGGEGLGFQKAVSQFGTLLGYLAVIGIFSRFSSAQLYRPVFGISAAIVLAGALCALLLKGSSAPDASRRRFYFRKKFSKYYMLEIFYGARKQVFFTFGPYVLILFYGADTAVISLLFAVSAVLEFFLAPAVGRLIDRVGYKAVMVADTLILVIVCFFYGFAHHLFPMKTAFIICCANYVLDAIISLASMASNVYVQDLSDSPEEMRATLSTGISVNHLITVLIALFGGWIWQELGVETLFILSAVLGLCNSAYAATIKMGEASH